MISKGYPLNNGSNYKKPNVINCNSKTTKEIKDKDKLNMVSGRPIYNTKDSLTIGTNGPVFLQDTHLLEKLAHFDRERIPERVVHAKGNGAFGHFTLYKSMSEFTSANFLCDTSKKTKILIRFSTVIGSRGSADTERDPRGFAVKFYTDEGNYDVVGLSFPVFFVRDAMKFADFIHSQKPSPTSDIKNLARAWDFFSLSPESLHAITWLFSDRGIVKDYRKMDGFGVNTFIWVNAKGERRYVKYHFLSQEKKDIIDRKEGIRLAGIDPNIAGRNLWECIERKEYPKYEFCVQMMDIKTADSLDFDPLDDTKTWPESDFPLIKVGMLELNKNPENYFAQIEQSAFAPGNIIPGIEFSADKMLQGRTFSYADTQRYRIGSNYFQLDVNKPIIPVNNDIQDGSMCYNYSKSKVNYKPNSIDNNKPHQAPMPSFKGMYHNGYMVRKETVKTDDYSQARDRYLSFTESEKLRLIDAIAAQLYHADKEIQERQLKLFDKVCRDLAIRLKHEIYLFETKQKC